MSATLKLLPEGHHYIIHEELLHLLHLCIFKNTSIDVGKIIHDEFSNRVPANVLVSEAGSIIQQLSANKCNDLVIPRL